MPCGGKQFNYEVLEHFPDRDHCQTTIENSMSSGSTFRQWPLDKQFCLRAYRDVVFVMRTSLDVPVQIWPPDKQFKYEVFEHFPDRAHCKPVHDQQPWCRILERYLQPTVLRDFTIVGAEGNIHNTVAIMTTGNTRTGRSTLRDINRARCESTPVCDLLTGFPYNPLVN